MLSFERATEEFFDVCSESWSEGTGDPGVGIVTAVDGLSGGHGDACKDLSRGLWVVILNSGQEGPALG